MPCKITIVNKADTAEINIEGVIGIPEYWQFENSEGRVSTFEKFSDALNQITTDEIVVNIRSVGGNVGDALLIYDSICALKKRTKTRCYGYTASAATIIAQAASDGCREISANSLYLIHQSSSVFEGNADEVEGAIEILRKTDERIANIYAVRSGKSEESFTTLMAENNGNGRWLSPAETIEHGLTDCIIDAAPITNMAQEDVVNLKLPELPNNILSIKSKTMKIKNTWNAILDFFGFDKDKENELTEAQVEKLNGELTNKANEVANLKGEASNLTTKVGTLEADITAKADSIASLTNKITELEAERDQLKAKATETPAKEDPAPQGGVKNERTDAYNADINAFKN